VSRNRLSRVLRNVSRKSRRFIRAVMGVCATCGTTLDRTGRCRNAANRFYHEDVVATA